MNKTPSDPIPSQPDERESIARLLTAAKLLQQNAIGCATNHHGHDCELNGLPGWLADTKKDIDAAEDAILAMQAERRGAEPRGCPTPGACSCPPAPIAGLEPVAWRYWWRSKYLTYSLNEPRPDDAEPLYTRAQLEAHAAEQVRPLVEALEGLIEAVELDADEGLEGIGSYTGARLTDAKNAIRARGQV